MAVTPVQFMKYIKGIKFPARKQDIIARAGENNAPPDVMDILDRMPDQDYRTAADVAKGYGKARK